MPIIVTKTPTAQTPRDRFIAHVIQVTPEMVSSAQVRKEICSRTSEVKEEQSATPLFTLVRFKTRLLCLVPFDAADDCKSDI